MRHCSEEFDFTLDGPAGIGTPAAVEKFQGIVGRRYPNSRLDNLYFHLEQRRRAGFDCCHVKATFDVRRRRH